MSSRNSDAGSVRVTGSWSLARVSRGAPGGLFRLEYSLFRSLDAFNRRQRLAQSFKREQQQAVIE